MRASANRWGSSSGTKAAVCAVLLPGSNHTLISAPSDDLAIVGNSLSLLQIFPAAAPTAFSLAAVQAAAGRPGKAAVQIRRQGAETVCRLLGGDLTLVDEIQRRHAQVAGTAEEEFLLANTQAGSTQQAVSHKRCLDDDDEVYAARKQQVLRQISQQTIREHAQGSMGILDLLSTGNTPPATLQLLQTIRHNVTARLGSMIESNMQGMLAIEAAPQQQQQQQQELSINQQAQRWTVQMYANKLGL
ncbi:TPA: hypothetical protein ACH3X2_001486 [Trebouxia sp. C0005]